MPLRLSLEAVRPARVPRTRRSGNAGAGFRLVVGGEIPIEPDDPLLAAYGAWVVSLADTARHIDALQDAGFAPGRELTLEPAQDECDRNVVRVLDAAGVLVAGHVAREHAARVAAALEHGLELLGIALWERRDLLTGERTGLRALVAPAAFVDVTPPELAPPQVERFPEPRRVVLAV
ncbi:MAG TPA: hypothetical protein VFT42_07610, partial [Solirubrobacteraceae bacterium]|nr:hypothetical protein [Solirubrobacteraceae bacterium]